MQTNNERHPVDKLKISANGPLNGEIIVSGAKNAALPLMCAGLLTSGTLRLKNVPMLADVKTTQKLLQGMGARMRVKTSCRCVRQATPTVCPN